MPLLVELERVEVEPAEPAGDVGAEQHASFPEAGGRVERVHRAQVGERRSGPVDGHAGAASESTDRLVIRVTVCS